MSSLFIDDVVAVPVQNQPEQLKQIHFTISNNWKICSEAEFWYYESRIVDYVYSVTYCAWKIVRYARFDVLNRTVWQDFGPSLFFMVLKQPGLLMLHQDQRFRVHIGVLYDTAESDYCLHSGVLYDTAESDYCLWWPLIAFKRLIRYKTTGSPLLY